MRAYIFLNLSPGHQEDLNKVVPKEGVVEYHRLTGEFDGVIVVDTNISDLHKIVDGIRRHDIVEKTVTFISWK